MIYLSFLFCRLPMLISSSAQPNPKCPLDSFGKAMNYLASHSIC